MSEENVKDEKPEDKKFVRRDKESKKSESKIDRIKNSKMPDHQKNDYVDRLSEKKVDMSLVSLNDFVKIKGLFGTKLVGFKAFAKSKKVDKLTRKDWNELLKQF
jgi:hypothetical protein